MKISCCWPYASSKYGYPPSLEDTKKALREMKDLGFTYVELGWAAASCVDWDGVFAALKKHGFDVYCAVDVGNVPHLEEYAGGGVAGVTPPAEAPRLPFPGAGLEL